MSELGVEIYQRLQAENKWVMPPKKPQKLYRTSGAASDVSGHLYRKAELSAHKKKMPTNNQNTQSLRKPKEMNLRYKTILKVIRENGPMQLYDIHERIKHLPTMTKNKTQNALTTLEGEGKIKRIKKDRRHCMWGLAG